VAAVFNIGARLNMDTRLSAVSRLLLAVSIQVFAADCGEASPPGSRSHSSDETVVSGADEQEPRQAELPWLMVLGIAQDAGFPQAGCSKECCQAAWRQAERRRHPASLAIVDPATRKRWLLDCTPAFPQQLRALDEATADFSQSKLDGIFLTHAHVGHYAGLIHLGREVMGATGVTVYAMPRMRLFLEQNGPWQQLVTLDNVRLQNLAAEAAVSLSPRLSITPFIVPHRDEYSETVGFRISGRRQSIVYLPDIDKWDRWAVDILDVVRDNDLLFLDGTFYDDGELPGRDMSQIPHPFVVESLARFSTLSDAERNRVHFLHLNHTNPLLDPASPQFRIVRESGLQVAEEGQTFPIE